MSPPRWREGQVIGVPLKGGVEVLAQMVVDPYLVFFDKFSVPGGWESTCLSDAPVLFVCAVTRSFLHSAVRREVEPARSMHLPKHWISIRHGSRWVTAWPGTRIERRLLLLAKEPGGRLVENDIANPTFEQPRVLVPRIDLADDATIDAHELAQIWTFPELNERLYLCHLLGRNVDPLKDLHFDRPLRPEYKVFVDMMAGHGTLSDWGYGGPLPLRAAKSPGATSKKKALGKTTKGIKKKATQKKATRAKVRHKRERH